MHSAYMVIGDKAMLLDYGYVPRVHAHVYEEAAIRIAHECVVSHWVSLVSTTSNDLRHGPEECVKPSESVNGCHDDYGESPTLAEHMKRPFPGFMTMR